MSDFSLTLVLQIKTSKIINDMAKIQQKSEKITAFGGIFHVRELFSRYMDQFIETEKYCAKMTYKKFTGYSPGVAVIATA